jgi:hypothetical protein
MAKQNKNSTNVSDFLSGAATPKAKSGKKNGIPEIEGQGELADRAYNANKAMKDATATYKALEAQILDVTAEEYEARAGSGDFTKTLNVQGVATPGVQVSYKDAFSDIPIEEKEALVERLGDRFEQYFEEKRVLTLSDTSDATVKLLLDKLGEDTFRQIFEIKVSIATKADMDRRQFDLPEDVRPAQYKASVKIRK